MNKTGNIAADKDRSGSGRSIRYDRYRPAVYKPRMSIFWWTRRKPYVLFIVRELTSIAVAAYSLFMLYMVYTLARGPQAWEALAAWLETPISIGLHVVVLAALLFHSITWFWIAPTAVVVKLGGKRLPGWVIIAGNLVMWFLFSMIIGWLILNA